MRPQKENQPQRPEALETVDKTIEKAQEHLEKSSIIRILSRSLPDIRICSKKPCKGGTYRRRSRGIPWRSKENKCIHRMQ